MAKEIKLNKFFIFHLKLLTSPSPKGRRVDKGSGGKNMTLNYFIQSSILFFYSFIYKFVLFLPPNPEPLGPTPSQPSLPKPSPYPLATHPASSPPVRDRDGRPPFPSSANPSLAPQTCGKGGSVAEEEVGSEDTVPCFNAL